MRFDRVDATAFGALRGASIEFPSNMTVVHGPNEAGKSTWFAATYAGLVGRRVGRGRGTKAQADFRRRHKPWSGSQWRVQLTLTLDSGRHLALDHDLATGNTRVKDAVTDRFIPVTQLERELGIKFDADAGFDGSRMLGLSREAVRATMFVGQADVLAVLHNAEELQEHLQRAASSARVDTTAEQALEWIAEQRRERVGSAHVGNRPLRATAAALEAAREALGDALDARHSLQELRNQLGIGRAALSARTHEVDELKRAVEWLALDQLAARISRAHELAAQVARLAAEPAPASQEAIARVTTAVEAFRSRGEAPTRPEGQDAAALMAEIEALPTMPEGPRQPEPVVLEAERRLNAAEATLNTLLQNTPELMDGVDSNVTPNDLRAYAQAIAEEAPVLAEGVRERIAALKTQHASTLAAHAQQQAAYEQSVAEYAIQQSGYEGLRREFDLADDRYRAEYLAYRADLQALDAAQQRQLQDQQTAAHATAEHDERVRAVAAGRRRGIAGVVSGSAVLVAAAVALVLGAIPVAFALGLLSAALITFGGVSLARRGSPPDPPQPWVEATLPSVRPEPQRPTPPQPPTPVTLVAPGASPQQPQELIDAERELDRWEVGTRDHAERRARAQQAVINLGLPSEPAQLQSLARAIEDRDAARQRVAAHLEQVIEARVAVTESARALLNSVGDARSVDDGDAVVAARIALDRYVRECAERDMHARAAERRTDLLLALDQRASREREYERALEAFSRAEADLAETAAEVGISTTEAATTAAHLDAWLAQQRRRAQSAAERRALEGRLDQLLDGETINELSDQHAERGRVAGERPAQIDPSTADRVPAAEQRRDAAAGEVARLEGRIRETERALSSIPEAIEREALAQRNADRVRTLDTYLALAETHLSIAKDRAHADIAPVLANTIRPWVPLVTAGSFTDVEIDAATLMVRAVEAGGRVRDADVLSQGTMEQLFLLLRIALAEHLSSTGERAPLVLDDVTVQTDRRRKEAILELLRDVSKERQVILFTQELEVVSWGIHNLPEGSVVGL
ncbi:energy-coupling factor transporter ATP-binding protein EcfA2 [Microbacterium trichothecenolyticum]|uniref:AAA family ATPase n=1 Tax=Microbacterium trichothecenolyticum TaxID=69370 RepID=UPI00285F12C5|nr:AAA family ATPase [Microbacterium trichothecenolyticum]MDR7187159.1 energy-coupling factor transporter ATP-binding protein EcfA2 [Microbacterium trichothecenolyticum]